MPHTDDDQIDFYEIMKDDDADDDEGAVGGGETQRPSAYRICLQAQCNVLFPKCRHQPICTPCYVILLKEKQKQYEELLIEWYASQDNELIDDMEVPRFSISCVLCREEHTEAEVISGIFR